MRELLFRGKRKDTGEWVYGSLIDKDYILQYIDLAESWIPLSSDHKVTCRAYEIIPETVGQFTGLTDKNGKMIFEGDTVECKRRNKLDSILGTIKGRVIFASVAYEGACIDCGESDWMELGLNKTFIYEVTGNIHEQELNPPQGNAASSYMNTQLDPGTKQEEGAEQQTAEATETNQASEAGEMAEGQATEE